MTARASNLPRPTAHRGLSAALTGRSQPATEAPKALPLSPAIIAPPPRETLPAQPPAQVVENSIADLFELSALLHGLIAPKSDAEELVSEVEHALAYRGMQGPAGMSLAMRAFEQIQSTLRRTRSMNDGDRFASGVLAAIEGATRDGQLPLYPHQLIEVIDAVALAPGANSEHAARGRALLARLSASTTRMPDGDQTPAHLWLAGSGRR